MNRRCGMQRWRSAVGATMGAMLAFALMGAAPLAFAEGDDEPFDGTEDVADAPVEDDVPTLESAFKLGDVTLTCVAEEDQGESALVMGEVATRTYLVTNEGERAYVRLASALLCGDLVQPNELGVSDVTLQEPDAEGGEDEDEGEESPDLAVLSDEDANADEDDVDSSDAAVDEEPASPVWRLADDGWWYRSVPLEPGERIAVHVEVKIPLSEEWSDALSTGHATSIEASFHMEAVQARNMAVDPEAERPWGEFEMDVFDEDLPEGEDTEEDKEVEEA